MKLLQKILALALALSLTMGLAACAPKTATPTSLAVDASASSIAPTSETPKLEGSLTFWTMWNDTEPQGEAMQDIADAFMEEYPGTTIDIQYCGRDLSKTLKPALEAGQRIDVFDYPNQYGGQLASFCYDLSELVDTPSDALNGKTLREILLPAMLSAPKVQTGITEGQITVGYKPYECLMMYNAKSFTDAGIADVPKTWSQLDDTCAKLKAAGYSPITFDDAYALFMPGLYLAREKGQEWVLELVKDKTGDMWKDKAVINMAKAYEDFAQKGYFDVNVGGNKWPAGQMDIANGKAAMYLNLTGLPTEVKDVTGPDFVWGAFNFPDVVDGQNRAASEAPSGCTMTAINTMCENKALAGEFVAFLHSTTGDNRMVEAGMTTTRTDGTWPDALKNVAPVFNSITVALQAGGGIQSNSDMKPIIAENFVKLASSGITAEQFVSNMVTAAKQ